MLRVGSIFTNHKHKRQPSIIKRHRLPATGNMAESFADFLNKYMEGYEHGSVRNNGNEAINKGSNST